MNSSQPNNGRIIRVLIVDDNSDAAHTTGIWLELNGHKVDVLTHSVECLPHLESFNPDVLLLDIAMPEISGYDLAKQIRSQPKFDRLVIFAVSGYADAAHVQRSIDCGCELHLIKPVDLHALKEAIASEVQKSHSALGG